MSCGTLVELLTIQVLQPEAERSVDRRCVTLQNPRFCISRFVNFVQQGFTMSLAHVSGQRNTNGEHDKIAEH